MVTGVVTKKADPFSDSDRAAIYRVIAERRDVRRGFLETLLPDDVLDRLFQAAHSAPSVGLMQPTSFILIRDLRIKYRIHSAFEEANAQASACYDAGKLQQYRSLKLEGILEAPQNICVVCDTNNARGHGLGRHTMPETAAYSTVCAIQNLWLAARAEGVGVGWISILDPDKLREILAIPVHITPVAYLCLGYVDQFASIPDLEHFGWENRIPLEGVVFQDQFDEADTL
jgi:5,6-dimethylbenzimidazole synthase